MAVAAKVPVDPVLAEILLGSCRALVDEADDILERASMGMVIRESRDYCSVVADPQGNVIATGKRDLPAFVGTIQLSIQAVIAAIGEGRFQPGDVYIVNDPWSGGTHYNDVRLIAPVHHEDRIIGYVGSCGHLADIGGMNPGSFAIKATSAYAEGLRIVPVLFEREQRINDDVWNLIMANIRIGKLSGGDLKAMLAAVHRAAERLVELADRHGPDVLAHWMSDYQDFGEAALRTQLAELPKGSFDWVDWIDADPLTGEPLEIRLRIEVRPDGLTFDFTGTDPQAKGSANAAFATTAALVYTTTATIFPEVPMNHGLMRAIQIVAPLGTVVNAEFPTAVSAMAATTFDIIAACIFGAFSKIVPERSIAASYNLQSFIASGRQERTGEEFVTYSWGPGGWGAGLDQDGRTSMALYTTTTTNIPIEAEERRIPFLVEEYAVVTDAGGAGRRRGGNSLRRVFRFDFSGLLQSIAGRGKFPIWGLFGGGAGAGQSALLERDGEVIDIGLLAQNVEIRPGDRLIYTNGGGGGYGPPFEREPERVLDDVLDGWITPARAQEAYGVVLREITETSLTTTFEIDHEATRARRGGG
jgi:N-methylhydantoinase B